jgi:DNA-binding transcriptional MerR regulator
MGKPGTLSAGAGLDHPERLEAVGRIRLHHAADRKVFDRLTSLVTALLDVPIALLTIVEADRQVFVSAVGVKEPWATLGEVPLTHSFCQHAVLNRAPLVIEDARTHPLVRDNLAIQDLDVVAYLGVPLMTTDGYALGSFCAIDSKARRWSDGDVRVLGDLAATVIDYVEARPETPGATQPGLNIAAVARRTGVAPDTLRKWERRYGVLRPSRTAGGQRRYEPLDVARVEWLRDRLTDGYRIGEAAALLDSADVDAVESPDDLRDAIVAAARQPEPRSLVGLVDQAFALHPLETAIEQIVVPALHEVGDGRDGTFTEIAHEHLLSEAVRARLERLLSDTRPAVRGNAVLACAPGERHELGLLALAALLQADGWGIGYAGADMPLDAAYDLARRLDADILCLSASSGEALRRLEEAHPDRKPGERPAVVVGGSAVQGPLAFADVSFPNASLGEVVARLRTAL